MKIVYADPPYPGMAHKYRDHPDYGGEVDHVALVAQLAEYDGWALSTAASTLQQVIALCPSDVRIGIWHRTNSPHPGNMGRWWWSWEPLIVRPARQPREVTRDVLTAPHLGGFMGGAIEGQKSESFARWLFELVGADPSDEFVDLFPGSGAIRRSWETWSEQTTLVDRRAPEALTIA